MSTTISSMSFSPSLGPLETKIMEVVWKKQSVSVKDVIDELSPAHTLAYTTVLTILCRLWKKGLLKRSKKGKIFVYQSKINKKQTIQSVIRSTLSTWIERYGDEAVAAFIDEATTIQQNPKSDKS